MKKFTLTVLLIGVAFLILCCFFTNGYARIKNAAETVRGQIAINLPDAPIPKVEININFGIASNPKLAGDKSVDLSEYAAYTEMLKGASIRTYDKEMKDLNRIVDHYRGILENEKWEHLVKIRDKFDLSLLYAEKPGILHGIFLMFTDDGNSSFVNIYGEIDFQKLGALFGQLLETDSEEPISKTVRNWTDASVPQQWIAKINSGKLDPASKPETTTTNR